MKESGEFELIERLCKRLKFSRRTLLGPGDDCALLAAGSNWHLLTIDSMVEGVHFELAWIAPATLGARALNINLSDIAAMGGGPHACVVNLGFAPGIAPAIIDRLYSGLQRAATDAQVDIVGGNVTRSAQLTITIAVLGDAGKAILRRDAARVGDEIFVTGTIGDAALGWRIVSGQIRAAPRHARYLTTRYRSPIARLAAGRALARLSPIPAAIDISDGFLQDLGHILERSRLGAEIDLATLPLSSAYRAVAGSDLKFALAGGEDYELLFCLPPGPSEQQLGRRLGVPVRRVGRILAKRAGLKLRDGHGRLLEPPAIGGWDQLRAT